MKPSYPRSDKTLRRDKAPRDAAPRDAAAYREPGITDVLIIGAGWAGLSAAVQLTNAGYSVTVLESAGHAGGRARSLRLADTLLDNGQHLLTGACTHALAMMQRVGVSPSAVLHAEPFGFRLHGRESRPVQLLPRSSRPWAVAKALYQAWPQLPWTQRLRGLLGMHRMLHGSIIPSAGVPSTTGPGIPGIADAADAADAADMTVAAWLRQHAQPPIWIEQFWEPLCLAILNTPVATASATLLQRVLRDTLLADASAAQLLIPQRPLGELFPEPAVRWLQQAGAKLHFHTRVTAITPAAITPTSRRLPYPEHQDPDYQDPEHQIRDYQGPEYQGPGHQGLRHGSHPGWHATTRQGYCLSARAVILAIPPAATGRLLPDLPSLAGTRRLLNTLTMRSISTVYLRYARPIEHLPPLVGLLQQQGQWLVPRALSGEPHWLAVVIAGQETAGQETAGQSVRTAPPSAVRPEWSRIGQELAHTFPELGTPMEGYVIQERRATLDARAGISRTRPPAQTAYQGLYLAGDHCATDLPSTLEGAVRSGETAARHAADFLS